MQGRESLGELLDPDQFHENFNFLIFDIRDTFIREKFKSFA